MHRAWAKARNTLPLKNLYQLSTRHTVVEEKFLMVMSTDSLNGNSVRNRTNEELGHVKDIMVDTDDNHIAYAVLSFGGFMGMGDKLFAIPWEALELDTVNECFILNVPKEKLENAPGFDKDNWPNMADRTWGESIYKHYDRTPYWTAV